MLSWIARQHASRRLDERTTAKPIVPQNVAEFLHQFGISEKYEETFVDLWATQFILGAYEAGMILNSPVIFQA